MLGHQEKHLSFYQSECNKLVSMYVFVHIRGVTFETALDGIRFCRIVWDQPSLREFLFSQCVDDDDQPAAAQIAS